MVVQWGQADPEPGHPPSRQAAGQAHSRGAARARDDEGTVRMTEHDHEPGFRLTSAHLWDDHPDYIEQSAEAGLSPKAWHERVHASTDLHGTPVRCTVCHRPLRSRAGTYVDLDGSQVCQEALGGVHHPDRIPITRPTGPRRFRVKTDVGVYEPQWAELDLLLYPDGTVGWADVHE